MSGPKTANHSIELIDAFELYFIYGYAMALIWVPVSIVYIT